MVRINKEINENNLILNVDSYKNSHAWQYPPGTRHISAYITARKNPYASKILFFGLQMFLMKYLSRPITMDDIDEAEVVVTAHGLPFNREGWVRIVKVHKGLLPIHIQAVREGSLLNAGDIQVQVTNTDPELPWLSTFIETSLLRAVWYPTTVATVSHHCKMIIKGYLEKTADNIDGLLFKLHDFGGRGTTSKESAGIGACAHLVNFMGTDTETGLIYARNFYDADMAGFSIPAAEHSTITSWGRDYENRAYENMIEKFGGTGKLFAVVSDSYDIFNAVDDIWGRELKDKVEHNGGCLVVRPDSGDPLIIPGQIIRKLMDKFGYSINSKGYRLLPPYLRVIQGDGVNPKAIHRCLENMTMEYRISADNIAFGMGAELLQKVNRDTLSYAMKGSAISFDDKEWIGFNKSPVGDPDKHSKAGRFHDDTLETVWLNGMLCRWQSWQEVKDQIEKTS